MGCLVCVPDPRLQDGHKLPRWNPCACHGTFVGITNIHASSVGLIRNPTTNRLSPQFHCIYDDYFETVTFNDRMPPPNWEELTLESLHKHPFDEKIPKEFIDNWDVPEEVTGAPPQREPDTESRPRRDQSTLPPPSVQPPPQLHPPNQDSADLPNLSQREPTSPSQPIHNSPPANVAPPRNMETSPPPAAVDTSTPLRRSTRKRKPVERFKFDKANRYHNVEFKKAHGLSNIKHYVNLIIKTLVVLPCASRIFHTNFTLALAMDLVCGELHTKQFSPDFFIQNPSLLCKEKF